MRIKDLKENAIVVKNEKYFVIDRHIQHNTTIDSPRRYTILELKRPKSVGKYTGVMGSTIKEVEDYYNDPEYENKFYQR